MILINLLPPELRRRRSGTTAVNPALLAGCAGGLAVLLLAGGYAWIRFVRIPHAEAEKAKRDTQIAKKKVEAAEVEKRKKVITEFERRRDNIVALINRKVYWARTIDDFATLLTGQWSVEGFQVCAGELAIAEMAAPSSSARGAKKAPDEVRYSFKWKYKILGNADRSGDYIQSFFKTVETAPFWTRHGFAGKPEDLYPGDRPRWNADLQKIVVEGSLDWQRVKAIAKTIGPVAAAPGAAPAAKRN